MARRASLGLLQLRNGNVPAALLLFQAAEDRTREPYVVYLARYFRGQASRTPEAKCRCGGRGYRGALATVPAAQSASFALSALLAVNGQRVESAAVINKALWADRRPLA